MKISNNLNVPDAKIETAKSFNKLSQGDKFKAYIVDIKQDSISIKLSDGSIVEAKSLMFPEIRIGQDAMFVVKENSMGQILLEMVKPNSEIVSNGFVKEILSQLQIPINKENISVIQKLMNNNIELSKENIQRAMFFKYSDEKISDNMFAFLLKENLPAKRLSIDILNNIISDKTNLKSNLLLIAEKINDMPNNEIKAKILSVFDINDNVNIKSQISKKLFINIKEENSISEIGKHFESILSTAKEVKKVINNSSNDIHDLFQNTEDEINFMKHINNYKEFIQIPFNFENKNHQAELYVFNNSKNKKNDCTENASILISLDLLQLGHVESFINKSSKNLYFQFRLENESIIKLIKTNIQHLNNSLVEKGYNIMSVEFKKIEEPFNITMDNNENNIKEVKNKRFSFDMRV